jgi:hypothetical protein
VNKGECRDEFVNSIGALVGSLVAAAGDSVWSALRYAPMYVFSDVVRKGTALSRFY